MPLCTASHPQSDSARVPEVEGPLPSSSSICWGPCVSQNLLGSQASSPRGQVTSFHLAWRQMEGTGWKTWHPVLISLCVTKVKDGTSSPTGCQRLLFCHQQQPPMLSLSLLKPSYTGRWHRWLPRWCMRALTRKFQEKYCSILETSAFASMFSNNRATLMFSTEWDLTCNIVHFPVNFLSYVW